jgi:hypothetical protein
MKRFHGFGIDAGLTIRTQGASDSVSVPTTALRIEVNLVRVPELVPSLDSDLECVEEACGVPDIDFVAWNNEQMLDGGSCTGTPLASPSILLSSNTPGLIRPTSPPTGCSR